MKSVWSEFKKYNIFQKNKSMLWKTRWWQKRFFKNKLQLRSGRIIKICRFLILQMNWSSCTSRKLNLEVTAGALGSTYKWQNTKFSQLNALKRKTLRLCQKVNDLVSFLFNMMASSFPSLIYWRNRLFSIV